MSGEIPVRILFLAAEPSDTSRLRLGQELRDIKERLRIPIESGKFYLEQRESVRIGDITQAIFDVKPHIIHFSGHGTRNGELCFEDEVGKVQLVEPDALAAMFKLFVPQVNCVVLNACYSKIQAQTIAEHIPFVVGMNDEIEDKAALAFAVGFYKALAANRSIEDAYEFGCVEIRLQGIPAHLIPVIHVKKSPIPVSKLEPEKQKTNPFVPQVGRVEDSRLFFEREKEIQRVFEVLESGSSVALIGEEEIGKSSLLWAICQQAESRLQAPRQPVFLDLNEIGNESDFYIALCDKLSIPECKGYKLTRNLRQRSQKVMLAIDNVAKFTWKGFTRQVRDQLRALAEGGDAPLRLVLAASEPLDNLFNDSHDGSKTSPLAGICQEEHIKRWDENTMRVFIANRLAGTGVSFREEDITQLIQQSGGLPKRLMRLCYLTFARYVEGVL